MKTRYGYPCFLLITAFTCSSVSLSVAAGNNTGIVAQAKEKAHFSLAPPRSNTSPVVIAQAIPGPGPGLLPECPDKVPPGLVDIVAVPVEKSQSIYIVGLSPKQDPYYYTVSTSDPSIAKIQDGSGRAYTQVLVPGGRTYSNPYKVQGVAMGQTTINHSSPYSSHSLPVGVWKVDGIVDYNDLGGNDLCYDAGNPTQPSADNAKKASCGDEVEGVAADGASRLLMRINSGVRGEACFKVVSEQPATDHGKVDPDPSGQVESVPYNSTHWAYSTYVPPEEFELSSEKEREVVVDFAFTPWNPFTGSYTRTNTLNVKKKIIIKRPPVLLVSGFRSGSYTWSESFREREPRGGWHIDDEFNYLSTRAFGTLSGRMEEGIKALVRQSRLIKDYATTKVDVIAHSMGALAIRSWMDNSGYRRDGNFQEGDIRKLVTLTTPHYGTPLANLIVNLHQNFANHVPFTRWWWLEVKFSGIHNGGLCSMAENSPDLNALNNVANVKGEAITAAGGTVGDLHGELRGFRDDKLFTAAEMNEHIDPYVFQDDNDGIVAVDSQTDSLPVAQNFASLVHSDSLSTTGQGHITRSEEVANKAYADLDSVGVFATSLPDIATNGDGVPYSVVGRGDAVDAATYTAQCQAGGPMRPAAVTIAATTATTAKKSPSITSSGVTVISPVEGSSFPPGATIPIEVNVAPSLQATSILVSSAGYTGVSTIDITGPPFIGNLNIPADLSGPLSLIMLVRDVTDESVGGAQFNINIVPTEIPVRLDVANSIYLDFPMTTPELSRTLTVKGIYADGALRDLSDPVTGTSFTSVNPAVATVTANGVISAGAVGKTYIETAHQGAKAYTSVVVGDPLVSEVPVEYTAQVSFAARGFRRDQETGRYVQQVVITNNGSLPLALPLRLVVDNLPADVLLANKRGDTQVVTPLGIPYVSVKTDEQAFVSPGNTASATLEFLNFQGVPITYTPRLFTARKP